MRIVPMLEAAATQPQLAILGDPGSGSHVCEYLGYCCRRSPGDTERRGWPTARCCGALPAARSGRCFTAEADLDYLPPIAAIRPLRAVRAYLPTLCGQRRRRGDILVRKPDAGNACYLRRPRRGAADGDGSYAWVEPSPSTTRQPVPGDCRVRSYQGNATAELRDVALARSIAQDPGVRDSWTTRCRPGQILQEAEQRTVDLRQHWND